jgi:hypothetical protein
VISSFKKENQLTWLIDVIGESTDIADISALTQAPTLSAVEVVDGPDGRKCLGGQSFAECRNAEEVRPRAEKALAQLNGLARLRHANHRPVRLGQSISSLHSDGRRDTTIMLMPAEVRVRVAPLKMTILRADGSTATRSSGDGEMERVQKMASNPRILEIAETLAGDITWQRLRVAFEKITALIDNRGCNHQAIWSKGYAEKEEVLKFKENVEHPGHGGFNAVHGYARGEPKRDQMTELEGLAFITRLLNTYLDRVP